MESRINPCVLFCYHFMLSWVLMYQTVVYLLFYPIYLSICPSIVEIHVIPPPSHQLVAWLMCALLLVIKNRAARVSRKSSSFLLCHPSPRPPYFCHGRWCGHNGRALKCKLRDPEHDTYTHIYGKVLQKLNKDSELALSWLHVAWTTWAYLYAPFWQYILLSVHWWSVTIRECAAGTVKVME